MDKTAAPPITCTAVDTGHRHDTDVFTVCRGRHRSYQAGKHGGKEVTEQSPVQSRFFKRSLPMISLVTT